MILLEPPTVCATKTSPSSRRHYQPILTTPPYLGIYYRVVDPADSNRSIASPTTTTSTIIYNTKKMKTFTTLTALFAFAYPVFAADATTTTSTAASATSSGVEEPSADPTLGAQVVQGCFSSWGNLVLHSTPDFNSKSACAFDICYAGKYTVAATSAGNECYCGTEYPPENSLSDDDNCHTPCPGYGLQACKSSDQIVRNHPLTSTQAVELITGRSTTPESRSMSNTPRKTRRHPPPLLRTRSLLRPQS